MTGDEQWWDDILERSERLLPRQPSPVLLRAAIALWVALVGWSSLAAALAFAPAIKEWLR